MNIQHADTGAIPKMIYKAIPPGSTEVTVGIQAEVLDASLRSIREVCEGLLPGLGYMLLVFPFDNEHAIQKYVSNASNASLRGALTQLLGHPLDREPCDG